ncbi:MAG: hypothetical protein J0G96_12275 [Flavobacteriia bacterium]|nr:hypothetical protein [Flavobacteriia bacterium]OJX39687.1 MAG: hypothetical protein BGO87_01660 [Flavobacteriia bacterium 40-80]
MKKILLVSFLLFSAVVAVAQADDCFKKLEDAFAKRGSYAVPDDMYRNVIVSFFEGNESYCYNGKARVENGVIKSIFIQYKDDTYDLFMDKDIYNAKKQAVIITNGISDMIVTSKGEKLKIVFIDKLKPKPKSYKQASLPDDL